MRFKKWDKVTSPYHFFLRFLNNREGTISEVASMYFKIQYEFSIWKIGKVVVSEKVDYYRLIRANKYRTRFSIGEWVQFTNKPELDKFLVVKITQFSGLEDWVYLCGQPSFFYKESEFTSIPTPECFEGEMTFYV